MRARSGLLSLKKVLSPWKFMPVHWGTGGGSILLILPLREEDRLADMIVYAISQAIRKQDFPPQIKNAKIAKIVYDVSESLDLPITRSWYMFGTYVWANNASENRLNQFLGKTGPSEDINSIISFCQKEGRKQFENIQNEVLKHKLIAKMGLYDFLDKLYSTMSPEKYRRLYISHRKMSLRLDSILDSNLAGKSVGPQFHDLSREISAFHKEMLVFGERIDMIDLVIDYTSFLEMLVIKHDSYIENPTQLQKLIFFYKKVYDSYKREIWAFPASVIAIETVKGERRDRIILDRNSYCAKLPAYIGRPSQLIQDARGEDLNPTREEILRSQETFSKHLGNDEKYIRTSFAEHLFNT